MFFKAKECCFYQTMVVMLIGLSVSSQPLEHEVESLKNSLGRDCSSTKLIISTNITNHTNGSCSHLKMNRTMNSTNGTKEDFYFLTEDSDYYIINIASMTVASIGMLCNILLILAIIIDPLKILHRGAWITILNLSVADFIACGALFLRLYYIQIDADVQTLLRITDKTDFCWMFGVGASFMLLTLLTVQIYVIIKYPMKSRFMLTGKKVALSCMIVWLLATGLGLSNISRLWVDWPKILYLYIGNIAALELATAIQVVLKILIAVEILGSRHVALNVETQNRKQKEVAKTVIMLNVILIVTAFPYFLAKQIELSERLRESSADSLLRKFVYYYEPIALLNFVSNPVLYSLRLQDYRRSLLTLFKCNCKKRRRTHSASSQRIMVSKLPSISLAENRMEMTKLQMI